MNALAVYKLLCIGQCCPVLEYRYVGLTAVGVASRLRKHRKDARKGASGDRKLLDWIRKHGPDNIRIELIQTYDTVEEMKAGEVYWIAELNTFYADNPRGLNMTRGGDGFVGGKHTEQWKADQSARAAVRSLSDKTRTAIGIANRGKTRTEEQKQHLREINTGKKHTADTLAKMSAAQTGREITEQHRERLSKSLQGHEVTQSTRDLISDRGKKRYEDPEERARGRRNLRKASHTRWCINNSKPIANCEFCLLAEQDG